MPTFSGSTANDSITGSETADLIYGGSGNDTLVGGGGADRIYGEAGSDSLLGGDGDDIIYLNDGNDIADGGAGTDTLDIYFYYLNTGLAIDLRNLWSGGIGAIGGGTVTGFERLGNFEASRFADTVFTGDVIANVRLHDGDDMATGGALADTLVGGSGNDTLIGGGGNDRLYGEAGSDSLLGGEGDDTIFLTDGNDIADGGAGTDTLDIYFYYLNTGVSIDLRNLWSGGIGSIGSGTVTGFERFGNFEASRFADTVFTGDVIANVRLHDGDDMATGGALADTLVGGSGNDTLIGGGGNDRLYGEAGSDSLLGGDGDDTIFLNDGNDIADGGAGTDTLDMYFYYLNAGISIDLRNLWAGGAGAVGGTVVTGFERLGNFEASRFADTVFTGDIAAYVALGDGNDMATGGSANDTLSGGNDNDTLLGGGGNDNLFGNTGNDSLVAGDGSDAIDLGDGNDIAIGGAGNDTIYGDGGDDEAIYVGPRSRYIVYTTARGHGVLDTQADVGNEGEDRLESIERLRFSDGVFAPATTATQRGLAIFVPGMNVPDLKAQAPVYLASPTATDSDDILNGSAGYDLIVTGAGSDVVNAGEGNDTIAGASYRYSYGEAGARVIDTDGVFNDGWALVGGDTLNGGAGDDEIYAGYGSIVDGGAGDDWVEIGLVVMGVPWVAGTILGTANNLGIAVNLGDALTGEAVLTVGGLGTPVTRLRNIERFTITFGAGSDTVTGGAGDDVLAGDAYNFGYGNDWIDGGSGNDSIDGSGLSDTLLGGAGNDTLFGGVVSPGFDDYAADSLYGGDGDDSLVGNPGDLFDGGAGTDIAVLDLDTSSFNYVVNLASLPKSGTPKNFGDGTRIVGIEQIQSVRFGSGNDNITGGNGRDEWYGNAGKDRFNGGGGDDVLNGGDDNDTLLGGLGNDILDGGRGNDSLDGGAGADTMQGGDGDDLFIVDNPGDVVGDYSGVDLVKASVSHILSAGIEKLTLTGVAAINGTGNAIANTMMGNARNNRLEGRDGADILNGSAGDDTLVGGTGADTLTGGTGRDQFVFDLMPASGERDTIKDFKVIDDLVVLSRAAFATLEADINGLLSPSQFAVATAATTSEQRLLYNRITGVLSYDADGSGVTAAIDVAALAPNLALTASHFLLVG